MPQSPSSRLDWVVIILDKNLRTLLHVDFGIKDSTESNIHELRIWLARRIVKAGGLMSIAEEVHTLGRSWLGVKKNACRMVCSDVAISLCRKESEKNPHSPREKLNLYLEEICICFRDLFRGVHSDCFKLSSTYTFFQKQSEPRILNSRFPDCKHG